MNWKEFLKLDKNKILLSILLFLSLPLIYRYRCDPNFSNFNVKECCIASLDTGLGFLYSIDNIAIIANYAYALLFSLIFSCVLSLIIFYYLRNKQNITDFIKPTKSKIIITFLIFLVAPILIYDYGSFSSVNSCPSHWYVHTIETGWTTLMYQHYIDYPLLPLQIFIIYLLSCVIVRKYNKFKHKNYFMVTYKELFKIDKYKIAVFTVILLLSNIPFIGTTNPLESTCQYTCTNSLDSHCSQTCHHTFKSRAIFWWPWQQMDTSITYLSYSKTGDSYESIISTNSIPLLHGLKQIFTYPRITDIIGLILTITYFYFVSCELIYQYNRLKTKTESDTPKLYNRYGSIQIFANNQHKYTNFSKSQTLV